MNSTITVTQLNNYIKAVIDENPPLNSLYVLGEISNFKHHLSGHMYFTLKDSQAQIKAVMFKNNALRLRFEPEDGMNVLCRGRVSVFEKTGQYQLYVEDMQPDGLGALNLQYEQLKEKLSKEGLFDAEHKKDIPKYPHKIGVATSTTGAAIEDIKNIISRRYPLCELVVVPTLVQGETAADDIIRSIEMLDNMSDVDVIIVGRGGGSIEDLWAFNIESVARAVYNCKTPIISAVGHETDFTISDFTADMRAPTPSAAAELAVPDISQTTAFINSAQVTLGVLLKRKLEYENQRFDSLVYETVLANKEDFYNEYYEKLNTLRSELVKAFSDKIKTNELELAQKAGKLDALSPLAVLSRGYATVEGCDNQLVKSVKAINVDDKIKVSFNDGCAVCTVDEVNYG